MSDDNYDDDKTKAQGQGAPAAPLSLDSHHDDESAVPEAIKHDSDDALSVQAKKGDIEEKEKSARVEGLNQHDDDVDLEAAADVSEQGVGAWAGAVRTQQSHTSSTTGRSRTLTYVPRSKRRGLLARLCTIPEADNPYDYSNKTKWIITGVVSLGTAAAPVGSTIFYPALPKMAKDLDATPTVTNLTIALYMLSMSIFPIWWSAFSEYFGRRSIYMISFFLNTIFCALSAVSVNVAMLIVMRVLGGGASASVQALGAGCIADIWMPVERGRAMGIFYLGPMLGPLFGPIIGGALSLKLGWRSTMWFTTIHGGLTTIAIIFCLPETVARRAAAVAPTEATNDNNNDNNNNNNNSNSSNYNHDESQTAKPKSRTNAAVIINRFLIDPIKILKYLRFPSIAISVGYSAISFGILYAMNISMQSSYSSAPYNFSELITGLMYVFPSLGYFLISAFGGRWIDHIMKREARKAGRYDERGKLVFFPEDRMRENAWLAVLVYPGALIWYGWTIQRGIIWPVPAIATMFFGFGSMLIFNCTMTMLTEFMPKRRSSGGIAINNFVRNILSCIGAFICQPLIDAIGNGWLFTMFGLFALVSGVACLASLARWSPKWRKAMDEKMMRSAEA